MPTHRESGLTLVETLFAIVLLGMVMFTLYGLVEVGLTQWVSLTGQTDVQQQPRVASSRVIAEVMQSKDLVVSAGGTSLGLVKVTPVMADAAAGASSVLVQDASALTAGRPVALINLNSVETVTASGIAGTTVSVTPVLSRPHHQGELVRRGETTLSAPAVAGSTTVIVTDPTIVATNDVVGIGGEGPLTVTGITGSVVSITPALTQTHSQGEVVQPLAVVFQLTGTQLFRNGIVLADLLAVPAGRSLFSVTITSLAGALAPGATQLCVQSVAGFSVNDQIQVDRETYGVDQAVLPDRRTVLSVNAGTNCLTVDRGLTTTRSAGTAVRVLGVDINLLGTQFNAAIGQTQQVAVTSKAALRN